MGLAFAPHSLKKYMIILFALCFSYKIPMFSQFSCLWFLHYLRRKDMLLQFMYISHSMNLEGRAPLPMQKLRFDIYCYYPGEFFIFTIVKNCYFLNNNILFYNTMLLQKPLYYLRACSRPTLPSETSHMKSFV